MPNENTPTEEAPKAVTVIKKKNEAGKEVSVPLFLTNFVRRPNEDVAFFNPVFKDIDHIIDFYGREEVFSMLSEVITANARSVFSSVVDTLPTFERDEVDDAGKKATKRYEDLRYAPVTEEDKARIFTILTEGSIAPELKADMEAKVKQLQTQKDGYLAEMLKKQPGTPGYAEGLALLANQMGNLEKQIKAINKRIEERSANFKARKVAKSAPVAA